MSKNRFLGWVGGNLALKSPCSEYARGTQPTEKDKTALVCLLGGGIIKIPGYIIELNYPKVREVSEAIAMTASI